MRAPFAYCPAALTFLLLTAPVALSAAPSSSAADVVLRSGPQSIGCPVDLFVERRSPTEMVNVAHSNRVGNSQRILLTFVPLAGLDIKHVTLTVHALSTKPQILPADAAPPSGIDRTFRFSGPADSPLLHKDLWIDGVGAISSVDLTSITYADGSTWHQSQDSRCSAVPNKLLLIDATSVNSASR